MRGLYKRGKVWYCRIAGADGRMIRRRLSTDHTLALTKLAELRAHERMKRDGLVPLHQVERVDSLSEIYRRYGDYMRSKGRAVGTVLSVALAWKRVILANHFQTVYDLSLPAVEAWAMREQASGKIRAQTLNNYVGAIVAMLRWAKDHAQIIHRNPLAGWQRSKVTDYTFRRDLRPEEVRAILDAEQDQERRLRWLVYFYTGLRMRAGAALDWAWVRWPERVLFLPAHANKSGRDHILPLHPTLYSGLLERWENVRRPPIGRVFRRVDNKTILNWFKACCRAAGVDMAGVCMHSARHTVATSIYEATGRDVRAVQELLGHASASTTMGYLHVDAKKKREAMEGLSYGD